MALAHCICLGIGSARHCGDMSVIISADQYPSSFTAILRMGILCQFTLPCCACCDALAHLQGVRLWQKSSGTSVHRFNDLSSLRCFLRSQMLCQSAHHVASIFTTSNFASRFWPCPVWFVRAADEVMHIQITTRRQSSSSRLVIAGHSFVSIWRSAQVPSFADVQPALEFPRVLQLG